MIRSAGYGVSIHDCIKAEGYGSCGCMWLCDACIKRMVMYGLSKNNRTKEDEGVDDHDDNDLTDNEQSKSKVMRKIIMKNL